MTIVGDGAVGKTTLVQALLKKTKDSNHNNSNGIFLEEKKLKVQIYFGSIWQS